MQNVMVGCLWMVNCFCWLLMGALMVAERRTQMAMTGAVSLAITVGLSSMLTMRRAARRRSQRNPERFYLGRSTRA